MTVGAAIAQRTGLRLFHNHQTIDLVLPYFAFGSPPFSRLVGEFRRRVFEEVAASDLPGLIFTYVWAFTDPSDDAAVDNLAAIFRARRGRALFVELEAPLAIRLVRNETPLRLAEKPSKRNVSESKQRLLELDSKHQMNSRGRFAGRDDYLCIDNTELEPDAVAERVIAAFRLADGLGARGT